MRSSTKSVKNQSYKVTEPKHKYHRLVVNSIMLDSILVYVFGLVGGLLLYRIKNKRIIINRMNAEKIEREEQEKKEQF